MSQEHLHSQDGISYSRDTFSVPKIFSSDLTSWKEALTCRIDSEFLSCGIAALDGIYALGSLLNPTAYKDGLPALFRSSDDWFALEFMESIVPEPLYPRHIEAQMFQVLALSHTVLGVVHAATKIKRSANPLFFEKKDDKDVYSYFFSPDDKRKFMKEVLSPYIPQSICVSSRDNEIDFSILLEETEMNKNPHSTFSLQYSSIGSNHMWQCQGEFVVSSSLFPMERTIQVQDPFLLLGIVAKDVSLCLSSS